VAIKEIAVLELYRRRDISSGKAAELLGMERFEFVRYASRLGIPFLDMDEMELDEEIGQAGCPGWGAYLIYAALVIIVGLCFCARDLILYKISYIIPL